MAGRIPMVGDPKPLDREDLGRRLRESAPRMHADALLLLEQAKKSGDKREIREARSMLKRAEKLMLSLGLASPKENAE